MHCYCEAAFGGSGSNSNQGAIHKPSGMVTAEGDRWRLLSVPNNLTNLWVCVHFPCSVKWCEKCQLGHLKWSASRTSVCVDARWVNTAQVVVIKHDVSFITEWGICSHGGAVTWCRGACSSLRQPPSSPSTWTCMSRATSNTCFVPPCTTTTTTSLLSLSACFSLSSPSSPVLCDLLKPGRHVITLLDTQNSRQPVIWRRRERREQGKQSDKNLADYQDILFDLRTCRFCGDTLNRTRWHINCVRRCDTSKHPGV